jgi:hypothetical protein
LPVTKIVPPPAGALPVVLVHVVEPLLGLATRALVAQTDEANIQLY